jgi:hypothetical protein
VAVRSNIAPKSGNDFAIRGSSKLPGLAARQGVALYFVFRNRLPLVDALRTLLLAPTSEVREILENPWAHRNLGALIST